jgi:photosystem II stability/assembly factor-like uncharacterized protein
MGPFGGTVRFLVSDMKEWVYSGIEGSGIFRSSDKGKNWNPINDGLPGGELYSFCIAPDGRIFCGGDKILAVSADHGDNWKPIPAIGNTITHIIVLPDSQIILAFDYNNILSRSNDNGVSWMDIRGIPGWGGNITKIERGSNNSVIVGTDGEGIFQIKSNVDTVTSLTYDLPKADRGAYPYYTCTGFVVLDDGTILMPYFYGLSTLSTNATQWVRMIYPFEFPYDHLYKTTDSLLYGYHYFRLAESKNLGKTWNVISTSEHTNSAMFFTKINNSFLLAARSGFWRSDDNGTSWNASDNGIARSDINCVLITSLNTVIIGTARSGLFRSTDLGANWANILFPWPGGLGDYIVSVKNNSKNTLFAASMGAFNSIWKSTTDGTTWSQSPFIDSNMTHREALVITDMTINSRDEIIVSGYTYFQDSLSGVFKSINDGNTWKRIFTVPNNTAPRSFLIMDDSLVIMGTNSNGFFRSTNLGSTWNSINGTSNTIQVISIIQDSASIILAASMGSGIVRSTDKGMTWNLSNSGLTNLTVRTISKLPNGMVLAGTEKGGFVSQDHGLTWSGVTTSVPFGTVRSVFVDSEGNIYLVTDAGLYKTISITSIHITGQPILPNNISLCQNYPNPFNPSTKIEFALPHEANISLKIYDVMGREVATLLHEAKSAGRYVVEWNGRNTLNRQAASGIYFYGLEAGNYVETKKMILLK